jgi:pimeloyl-ACP methyl ester carboxylesterase
MLPLMTVDVEEPLRLEYTDQGRGEPVLLVHGWGGDGRAWETVRFPGRRVVTVDLRGHGRSPVPRQGYRPTDYAGDLASLVRSLRTPPVVAVGHSMGGQIVAVLAIEYPELVRAVVAIDPAYGAGDAEAATFEQRLADLRREGARAAERQLGALPGKVRDQLLVTPGHVLAESYAGMYTEPGAFGARPAASVRLAQLTRPLLCVRPLPSMAAWDAGLQLPDGSRVVAWEGLGHFLHQERPDEFARLVADWLATLRPTRRCRSCT